MGGWVGLGWNGWVVWVARPCVNLLIGRVVYACTCSSLTQPTHPPIHPPPPQQMERWGNGRARAYYEAEVPSSYTRPSDWSNVHQMTKWIKVGVEWGGWVGGWEEDDLWGKDRRSESVV